LLELAPPGRLEAELVVGDQGRPPDTEPAGDQVHERGDELGDALGALERRPDQRERLLVRRRGFGERLTDQRLLRVEVVRRRRERNACLGRDGPVRDGGGAFTADERDGGLEDRPPPPFAARRQCPPAAFRPTTPTTISPRLATRSVDTGSPSATIPISAIAAVPTPAHTAYVSPSDSPFSASASSTIETP